MSNNTPIPAPSNVIDAPGKPWKALVAALSGVVLVILRDYFAGENATSWAGLGSALVSGVVLFLLTFVTKNPKVVTGPEHV
jgi:hypothetical protein